MREGARTHAGEQRKETGGGRGREHAPERLPAVCPALPCPLPHRGRLELVGDREEDDVLRVHVEIFAELDGAIDGDVIAVRV